jgi:hypothetical protein
MFLLKATMLSFTVKEFFAVEGLDRQHNPKQSHDNWLWYVCQLPKPSLGGLLEHFEDVTGFLAVLKLSI